MFNKKSGRHPKSSFPCPKPPAGTRKAVSPPCSSPLPRRPPLNLSPYPL